MSRKHHNYPSAYDSFEDIPADRRLETYESRYKSQNLLEEYVTENFCGKDYTERFVEKIHRAVVSWKQICETMSCHPALASPEVVRAWCKNLLEARSKSTVRGNYLVHISNFYRHLMWHVDFPHTYNPVQFAVRKYPTVNKVWSVGPRGDGDE